MAKKVNLKTIAEELDLSVGTVSRVLNGKAKKYRIKDDTVKKVLSFAKDKGYAPNMIAQGLRVSKTFTIGLMIPDIANPFFSMMAKNIEKAASEANYSILLVDASEDIEKEKSQVINMLSRKVDGIIAAPVGTSFDHFQSITDQNIPLVFVDRYSTKVNIPFITSDNYQGGLDATRYLIDKGHTNIALIRGDEIIEPVLERKRGYEDALLQSGLFVNAKFIVGKGFSEENGYVCTKQLLKGSNKPSAIFAMSNLIGLGVLRAVKELKLNIPDDLSLIVFDDQPYVSYLNPPITTVRQNSVEIGAYAIDLILSKIKQVDLVVKSHMLPVTLMHRESVRSL